MITFKQFAEIDPLGNTILSEDGIKLLQIVRYFTQSTPKRSYYLAPVGTTENGSICWGIHYTKPSGGNHFYSPCHDYLSRTAFDKVVYYAEHEFIGWDVDRPVPLLPLAELDAEVQKKIYCNLVVDTPQGGLVNYLTKRINSIFSVDLATWVNPNA